MSTNSDLQQINVFSKGMNTDTSDAFLSSEQYRYAENLRFITDTGENSGELRLIEGYKEVYDHLFGDSYARSIIASTSIRNLLIFLTHVNFGRGHDGSEVLVLNTDTGKCTYPYISEDKWNSQHKYSLVTRWESNENVKLYIADGEHEIMSLNLVAPDGTYDSMDQLAGLKSSNLSPIVWSESSESGNIKCSVIQYCYYLYNNNGSHSDLSPTTEIIRLYNDTNKGFDFGEDTGKAIDLEINSDQEYQNIILFRIEYLQNGSSPSVYMIYDHPVEGNTIEYTDRGDYGMSYSLAQLLSIRQYKFIPRIIESKNDRLFAANILDIQEQINSQFEDVEVSYELINEKQYGIDQYGRLNYNSQEYGPSLMAGETYRYGFVFYTDDGKYSSVLNVTNVTVPKDYEICDSITFTAGHRPDPDEEVVYTGYNYLFSRIGVRFTISNLPSNCSGYEIVRCERTSADSLTLSQGILGSTFGIPNSNTRYASTLMTLQKIEAAGRAATIQESEESAKVYTYSDLVVFASPESSYQMDDVIDVMNLYSSNINVREIHRYNIKSWLSTADGFSDFELAQNKASDQQTDIACPLHIKFQNNALVSTDVAKILYNMSILHSVNDNNRFLALNYLCPDSELTGNIYSKIHKFSPIYSPDASGFDDNGSITVENDSEIVDTLEYINWYISPLVKDGEINITDSSILEGLRFNDETPNNNRNRTISSGKKGVLLKTDITQIPISFARFENTGSQIVGTGVAPVSVVNIERSSVNPYGGDGPQAYLQNTFYSFGNYRQRTSDTEVADVYDGDVYNCMFIYNSAHAWESSQYVAQMFPTIYAVPIQSRIDLMARTGDLYPDFMDVPHSWWFQDLSGYYSGFVQDKDAYMCNLAHSIQNTAVTYTYQMTQGADNSIKDTRVIYSEPKTDNELIDSWTDFKPLNFLDVDTRYGEITNMRLFKNSLIYWQKNASGVLAVNERTILQDVNDANIILGNGDVLQRYDYLSLKYGMTKDQFCDTQSDNVLYWWDQDNKDMIMYSGGQAVQPMKIAKSVSNLINKSSIVSPTLSYDNKYKEIILSSVAGKSLAYNEMIQQFTSLYDITFSNKAEIGDKLFLIDDYSIKEWNKEKSLIPILKYIVNEKHNYVKVYDNANVGMGELFFYVDHHVTTENADKLKFKFNTLGQSSECEKNITSREYDLRFAIPRSGNAEYGGRMRGKTMQCELTSSSANFSIRYIITKYRISWS